MYVRYIKLVFVVRILFEFVQLASSEWVLGVQIRDFMSSINAGIRNNQYCCCDMKDTCSGCVQALNSAYMCSKLCNPYFEAHLLDRTNPMSCTKVNLPLDSLPMISSLVFQISSEQSAPDNQVSIKNYE